VMHQALAAAMDRAFDSIRAIQQRRAAAGPDGRAGR